MSFLREYTKVNNSFNKTLVFRVGAHSGFYSELNGMIFTMLYCLDKKIKFVLNANTANFANKRGWGEFFLPFVDEDNDSFHAKHNYRFATAKAKALIKKHKPIIQAYKKAKGITYLTYDIFGSVHNKLPFVSKEFDIEELGLKGNTFQASKELAKMVYRFNSETEGAIKAQVEELHLPAKYVAIHIRGGDIVQEADFRRQKPLEADAYIEKIEKVDPRVKHVFVFTDEYRHVERIRAQRPDWAVYTLCVPEEKGFVCEEFLKQTWAARKEGQLKLFTNVQICSKAQFFVGTYTSNPDWFLYLMMENKKFHCVDCDVIEWQVLRNKHGILSKFHNVEKINTIKEDVFKKILKGLTFSSGDTPVS